MRTESSSADATSVVDMDDWLDGRCRNYVLDSLLQARPEVPVGDRIVYSLDLNALTPLLLAWYERQGQRRGGIQAFFAELAEDAERLNAWREERNGQHLRWTKYVFTRIVDRSGPDFEPDWSAQALRDNMPSRIMEWLERGAAIRAVKPHVMWAAMYKQYVRVWRVDRERWAVRSLTSA